jgi:hypothetical protein
VLQRPGTPLGSSPPPLFLSTCSHRSTSVLPQRRRSRPESSSCPCRHSRVPRSSLEVTNLPYPYFSLVCPRLCVIARRSRVTPPPSHLIVDCHPLAPLCRCCAHAHVRHVPPILPEPFPVPWAPACLRPRLRRASAVGASGATAGG